MAKQTAGLLLFREHQGKLEVLLVHPGGPFWARKDNGAWSVPKGELDEGEDPLAAAKREFEEETGFACPAGPFLPMTPVRLRSGRTAIVWAVRGDCDPTSIRSNSFSIEWPPRSGRQQEFPEVDRAGWFSISEAHEKLAVPQRPLLDALCEALGVASPDASVAAPPRA